MVLFLIGGGVAGGDIFGGVVVVCGLLFFFLLHLFSITPGVLFNFADMTSDNERYS